MNKGTLTIVNQKQLTDRVIELQCEGSLVSKMTNPGQFVHIRLSSEQFVLRRPISICDVDTMNNRLTLLYRMEGKGTSHLATERVGEKIDMLGPLGNGFPLDSIKEGETALLVGGGVGVPPLYYLSKKLQEKNIEVIHVLGFQSKDDVFYEKEFASLGRTYISTVDGTYGSKGVVTNTIVDKDLSFQAIYACGPTPMLRALSSTFPEKLMFLSLEERMGCGIGACLACVRPVKGDTTGTLYKKICTDGPVFSGEEIVI